MLGHRRFVDQLDDGVAAHHAGMVPPMKEVVEACFIEGLVKVVFATETLAVGINMPARSVVIEKLTKFTGDHHERLTPGEYTQLTGRAGRRGIDERGDAVVLWSPWVRFGEVAELAGSSSFHLRSAFRPTYNMAANLIRIHSRDEAHHLLNLSFAQYQADRDVVRLEARLERRRIARHELLSQAQSPYGDITEYRALRDVERDERRVANGIQLGRGGVRDAPAPARLDHQHRQGRPPGECGRDRQRPPQGRDPPDADRQAGRPVLGGRRRLRRAAVRPRPDRPARELRAEPPGLPRGRGPPAAQGAGRTGSDDPGGRPSAASARSPTSTRSPSTPT